MDRRGRWKTPISGLAHSSPTIWGDRLFVTSAVSSAGAAPLKVGLYGSGDSADDNGEQSWVVYCLDKNSGRILWERTAARPKRSLTLMIFSSGSLRVWGVKRRKDSR